MCGVFYMDDGQFHGTWMNVKSWKKLISTTNALYSHQVSQSCCIGYLCQKQDFQYCEAKNGFLVSFSGDMYNYVQFIVHSIVQAKVKMYNVKMLWLLHATTASKVKKVKMVWNYTLSRLLLDVRCSEYTYQHHLIKKRRLISRRNIPEDITRVHLC